MAGREAVAGVCRVAGVITQKPIRSIAAAVAALVIVGSLGCGGPSDQEQIQQLVKQYVTAFAAEDGAKVCSLLTPESQRRIQASAGLLRGRTCAETLKTVAQLSTKASVEQVKAFHAGRIVIDGNEAGVVIEPSNPGTKPTRLVKINGKWLFDGSVAVAQR
jgi:hypothetical protein